MLGLFRSSFDFTRSILAALLASSTLAVACGDDTSDGSANDSGGAGGSGGAQATAGSGGDQAGNGGDNSGGDGNGGDGGAPSGGGGAGGTGTAGTGGEASDASAGGAGGAPDVDAGACTQEPDAGADCNTLTNSAPSTNITTVSGTIPEGDGGTIYNGTYFLTSATIYPGSTLPDGVEIAQTLVICDGEGQLSEEIGGSGFLNHKSFTFDPSGTDPNNEMPCSTREPDTNTVFSGYTASATQLILYSTDEMLVMTYERQ